MVAAKSLDLLPAGPPGQNDVPYIEIGHCRAQAAAMGINETDLELFLGHGALKPDFQAVETRSPESQSPPACINFTKLQTRPKRGFRVTNRGFQVQA